MKKTLLLIIVTFVQLQGCTPKENQMPLAGKHPTNIITIDDKGENYRIVEIDKCQYIIFYGFYSNINTVIIHKANCNNPIHEKIH